MDTKGCEFANAEEMYNFIEMDNMQKSDYILNKLKNVLKAYGEDTRYMKYDSVKKLWVDFKPTEFQSFMFRFYGSVLIWSDVCEEGDHYWHGSCA